MEGDIKIKRFQMDFAVPVTVSSEQQQAIHALFSSIVDSPANQFEDGVHWMSGWGSLPSRDFTSFDDDVLAGQSTAREFVSEKERERVTKRRKAAANAKPH